MRIPTVNQCCCGCSLKQGCFIIGGLWAISSFISVITYSAVAGKMAGGSPDDVTAQTAYNALRGFLIVYAILTSVQLCICLSLLYGTWTYKSSFILPWLFTYAVLSIISVLGYISVAIIYFAAFNVGGGFGILIAGLCSTALAVYCLIVVNSHYRILKEDVTPYP